ncbi:MAG TPA: class I SAM-dependent DNA methyltransferase [Gemmatimonadales bacterium]
MTTTASQIVNKAKNFAHVLRDDGLSYMGYTEQITMLLFLKMADEQTRPPYNRKDPIPPDAKGRRYNWPELLSRDGEALETQYRKTIEHLARQDAMLGVIFKRAKPDIQSPATLKRLIVDLIDAEDWLAMDADVKGDIYEGLLDWSAAESPKGAGQYFTPRPLIQAIVDAVQPKPDDTVCDPACGTGGFLLAAHQYVVDHHGSELDRAQQKHLRERFVVGTDLVPNTARLCVMNLLLHGIKADPCPIQSGIDSLAGLGSDRYTLVLTNPPFGKKSSITIVGEDGDLEKEEHAYERQDFWVTTKNKQLNFVQHVKSQLKVPGGRCAIVVPDNVLFEGGAGETVRKNLLQQFDVHTLLRLPTGIFYAQGVKANVLFFDAKPAQEKAWTKKLWVYDLRTNMHFTLKTNPLKRSDLDELVACYKPGALHKRKSTWDAEKHPDGRWRAYEYDELVKRDKLNLDIFWLRDKSLEDSDDLADPAVLAQEIADDLAAALEQFRGVAEELG